MVEFGFVIEYKLGKANELVNALSSKAELASIRTPNFCLVEMIKEDLEHDPQAIVLKKWSCKARKGDFG